MPRQNTTVLVYRDEIEQFTMLMNQGLPLDSLIHLTFKKDEEILNYLKEGKSLVDVFTQNQKKLYFKYCYEVTFVKTKLHSYFKNIQF